MLKILNLKNTVSILSIVIIYVGILHLILNNKIKKYEEVKNQKNILVKNIETLNYENDSLITKLYGDSVIYNKKISRIQLMLRSTKTELDTCRSDNDKLASGLYCFKVNILKKRKLVKCQ